MRCGALPRPPRRPARGVRPPSQRPGRRPGPRVTRSPYKWPGRGENRPAFGRSEGGASTRGARPAGGGLHGGPHHQTGQCRRQAPSPRTPRQPADQPHAVPRRAPITAKLRAASYIGARNPGGGPAINSRRPSAAGQFEERDQCLPARPRQHARCQSGTQYQGPGLSGLSPSGGTGLGRGGGAFRGGKWI